MSVREALVERLLRAGMTVATAESCTGGAVAAAIVSVAGASAVFPGAVVSYTEEIKHRLLGVPLTLIREKGVVSTEVALAMAQGARRALGADLAVSTTGLAGPGGGSPALPVGTVCIAVSGEAGFACFTEHFSGDREQIRGAATESALVHLLEYLDTQRVF